MIEFEVSLLAWGADGGSVRLVGRTRDRSTVELVREQLRQELDRPRDAEDQRAQRALRVVGEEDSRP